MDENKRPIISVIIPVHNGEKCLQNLFDSLRAQSLSGYEVIMIDDNSTDNSAAMGSKYARVISTSKNVGPAAARNIGISQARGEIIAFTDSDCVLPTNWLQNIYQNFKEKNLQVIAGNVKIPKSNILGDSISALGFPGGGSVGFDKIWRVDEDGTTDHITSCNFAASREVLQKHGAFDESFPLPGCEDPELSYRFSKLGVDIKYCHDVIVFHEPRTNLLSFIQWQLIRGRGNFYFKKKMGKVGNFIKLRIWSSMNIIKAYHKDMKFPIIFFLLSLSFILQQIGYFLENFHYNKKKQLDEQVELNK